MLFRSVRVATTEIYTLSLHDALPIWPAESNSSSMIASRPHDFAFREFCTNGIAFDP